MLRSPEHAIGARPAAAASASPHDAFEFSARRGRVVRRIIRLFVQALVVVALVSVFFLRVPQVEGRSMQPSIQSGNHVLINTLSYGVALGPWLIAHSPIRRGDIVAFERGEGDDRRVFLKRVVALPGESVSLSNGEVTVQGQKLQEDYNPEWDRSSMRASSVPAGTVFVLGDNRAESDDSRSFGPIPESSIIGKALFVIWPLDNVKRIR